VICSFNHLRLPSFSRDFGTGSLPVHRRISAGLQHAPAAHSIVPCHLHNPRVPTAVLEALALPITSLSRWPGKSGVDEDSQCRLGSAYTTPVPSERSLGGDLSLMEFLKSCQTNAQAIVRISAMDALLMLTGYRVTSKPSHFKPSLSHAHPYTPHERTIGIRPMTYATPRQNCGEGEI
jgi:hypothetical protein